MLAIDKIGGNYIVNYYGLRSHDCSEFELPEALRQTRNNKIILVDTCEYLLHKMEYYKEYCKNIPEEDNAKHAELVQKFTAALMEVKKAMTEFERVPYQH